MLTLRQHLFLLACLLQGHPPVVLGVQVLEFQKNGVASLWTVAEYQGQLNHSWKMDSLTFCARFKIFFLHSRSSLFQLEDTIDRLQSQMLAELWLDRVRPVFAHRWKFQLLRNKLRPYHWYHLCFTYDHLKHLYNTFINGELVYELEYNVGRPVYGNHALLGQGNDVYKSFSGALSQVNLWDSVVSTDAIEEMAACETNPQGNYLYWEAGWTLSNVTKYDVPLKHFCESTAATIHFFFPKLPQDFAFYICDALGSHLPLPTTMDQVYFWYNLSAQKWPNDADLCTNLWTPITDSNKEGTWVIYYDHMLAPTPAWKDGEPNGIVYENCAQIEPHGVADINCPTNLKCAICEFPERQIFSLLGTCELELRNVHFIAYQEAMGGLVFKGYGEYHIFKEGEEWLWVNIVKNKTLARLDSSAPFNMPMGRREWHLETQVCDQVGGVRMLVLTPCESSSFTCDDATCIPLDYRCDLKYDCLDRSDEAKCEIISKPTDYGKDLPPRLTDTEGSNTLPVTVEVTVESAAIQTMEMTMKLSYEMKMTWFDNRLTYRNLKTNRSLNKVTYSSMKALWSPIVGFLNTEGHQHTTVDYDTSLFLTQLQPSKNRDSSAPGEVDLFWGKENPLTISRKYSTTFICNFDLELYPFDVQHCDMHLQMLSASRNYLTFDQMASTATLSGNKLLLEYEIGEFVILYNDNGEFSQMWVRVPLERLAGYAILNIYTPSLMLLVINFVSLFFSIQLFEVRIMTTLTSLLVMATLFTQVSASLPKTSYFKMVDVWLIFCIVMSFLIIIFHSIIDNFKGDVSGDAASNSSTSLLATIKVHPSGPPTANLKLAPHNRKKLFVNISILVTISRYTAFALFVLFNVIYWWYIFG